jgi:transposase IS66 family protein
VWLGLYRLAAIDERRAGSRRAGAIRRKARVYTRGWVYELRDEAPARAKSPLGQAVGYALNPWEALTGFLDDPKIPLDNDVSETCAENPRAWASQLPRRGS